MELSKYKWIDIHAHMNMLDPEARVLLEWAEQQGVERIITIGTCPEDNPIAYNWAKEHSPRIFCCLGIHPHDADKYTPKAKEYLLSMYDDPLVVGVGEIGLDYYYETSPKEIQKSVFREMLSIAQLKKMPVQIHTRDAEQDTVSVLKEFKGQVAGTIHCFTGTQWLADEALALGLDISFSGIVTFKTAHELREVVKKVPLDRLHIETDSPFLAPMPHRGKQNNPSMMVHTAQCIADLKQVSLEELSCQTQTNAKKLFPKLQW